MQGRLILDLMNEPDAYGGKWDEKSDLPAGVSDYYLTAMDALYPLCKTCLFLVQGTGRFVCLRLFAITWHLSVWYWSLFLCKLDAPRLAARRSSRILFCVLLLR